jgi:UDP-glucose 4-epimerase
LFSGGRAWYAAVIPAFIKALLQNQPLRVFGDGQQSRDFTYVANVVHGNLLAMTAPHVDGQVINLALGGRTSLLELIASLEALSQRRAQVLWLPPRAGDVKHSQADTTRAKSLLGFATAVDVEEGLARTLAYYRQGGQA